VSTKEFNYEDLFIVYEDGVLNEVYLITEHYKFEHESIQLKIDLLKDELIEKIDQEYHSLEADTEEYQAEAKKEREELEQEYWSTR